MMTEKQPLRNSADYGTTMRTFRESVARVSRDDVAAAGGPSTTVQAEIEIGQHVSVSAATVDKYACAYSQLCGSVDSSFFYALAAAHAAADSTSGETARWQRVQDIIGSRQPNDFEFFLGLEVGRGESLVTASALRIEDGALRRLMNADDEQRFLAACCNIANRHPALTLVPAAAAEDRDCLPRSLTGSVGHTRDWLDPAGFDPLVGVKNLRDALARASVLGAVGDDAVPTAWAILAANALGYRQTIPPIQAWAHMRRDPAHFLKVLPTADSQSALVVPSPAQVFESSAKHLLRWFDAYTAATCQVSIDSSGSWSVNRLAPDSAVVPRMHDSKQVWAFDDDHFSELPTVLAQCEIAAAVLSKDGLEIATRYHRTTSHWFPCRGHASGLSLLRGANGRWIATRMVV